MNFETFLWIMAGICGAAIVFYIAVRLNVGTQLLESTANTSGEIEADQFYYLPGYGLTVKALATLELFKKQNGDIEKYRLKDLQLQIEVLLQPDTSKIIALKYKEDWFSSDEFTITTSRDSLLQTISASSEDRIGYIIRQFTAAPEEALKEFKESFSEDEFFTESLPVNKEFKFSAAEVARGAITLDWQIRIGDDEKKNKIDISLPFKNKDAGTRITLSKSYGGILTRPMCFQSWELEDTIFSSKTSFNCYAPDASRLMKIPIRRSFFTKKQQLPKFSDGILIENHIIKSSEVEALASIPINILKAIFSIPSQLFRFRIIRTNQETKSDKALLEAMNLNEELRAAQKKEIDALGQQVQEFKKVQAVKEPQTPAGAVNKKPIPPLGKLPAQKSAAEFEANGRGNRRISEVFTNDINYPESHFWNEKYKGTWSDYGNKLSGLKICVPAAAAHMIMCWSCNTQTSPLIPDPELINIIYQRESGYTPGKAETDVGCFMGSFLINWQRLGIGDYKIQQSAPIPKKFREHLKQAIYCFGPTLLGFSMPESVQQNDLKHWQITKGKSSEPGSWGGHAVTAIGYDKEGLLVVSWGELVRVDWNFYETYNDEAFVALSELWVNEQRMSPSQRSMATLETEIRNLNA